MKKIAAMVVAVAVLLGLGGVALAQWGGPGMGGGPCWNAEGGPQGQAWGPRHGRGMMGRGGFGPGAQGAPAAAQAIDDAKAKQIAADYVTKSLPGYKVEKLSSFQMRRGTMYQVEVRGPKDELQYLHINPWGAVRAFPARTF